VLSQAVTAQGVRILICTTAGNWTTDAVNNLLVANARDLDLVGPHLTVQLQTTYATTESTTAVCCTAGGGYASYAAVVYLNPSSTQAFARYPDALMAHEYGHAWTNYWRFLNPANAGSWNAYLSARGLLGNASVNSSYNWAPAEMAADDYRRLFGTPAAQGELAYINPDVPDSQQVPGLADFFLNQWSSAGG
jgi:hypothetical protein